MIDFVRGKSVNGSQYCVEVVSPKVITDKAEDCDPHICLEPIAFVKWSFRIFLAHHDKRYQKAGSNSQKTQDQVLRFLKTLIEFERDNDAQQY